MKTESNSLPTPKQCVAQSDPAERPAHSSAEQLTQSPAVEPSEPASSTEESSTADAPHADSAGGRGNNNSAKQGTKAPPPPSRRERLLAPFVIPAIMLKRDLVPGGIYDALKEARLTSAPTLPAATFIALAAVGAVTGPQVLLRSSEDEHDYCLTLRVAVVGTGESRSVVPASILGGLYAVQNAARNAHRVGLGEHRARTEAAAERDAAHRKAAQAAASVDLELPMPPVPTDVGEAPGARPQIVVVGGGSVIRTAAAGGTGIVLINDRGVPSLTGLSNVHDDTAKDLTALNAGDRLPVPEADGSVLMRRLPAAVLGFLPESHCANLYKVTGEGLADTVFVRRAQHPIGGESGKFEELLLRVYALGEKGLVLHLSPKSAEVLQSAGKSWQEIAGQHRSPLSDVCRMLPSLAARLAALLQIVSLPSNSGATAEVAVANAQRAVRLVDSYVLPMAIGVLGPASAQAEERDARRIIAELRKKQGPGDLLERRTLVTGWQKSMPVVDLNPALALLQQEEILIQSTEKGAPKYRIGEGVFA